MTTILRDIWDHEWDSVIAPVLGLLVIGGFAIAGQRSNPELLLPTPRVIMATIVGMWGAMFLYFLHRKLWP